MVYGVSWRENILECSCISPRYEDIIGILLKLINYPMIYLFLHFWKQVFAFVNYWQNVLDNEMSTFRSSSFFIVHIFCHGVILL